MRTVHGLQIDTVSTAIEPPLSEAAAEAWIPRTCFKNGPPTRIGIELELLVVDSATRSGLTAHYPRHRFPALVSALTDADLDGDSLDGTVTVEPGGQVELSSRPGSTLQHAVDTMRRDLTILRRRAARCGAGLVGLGADPARSPRRITDNPRYVAMERYLDAWGPAGRTMMCSTASVQVNVEAGVAPPPTAEAATATAPIRDHAARWELLHAIGPTLVAAFANSPRCAGRETGWKSTRQGLWLQLDPARTGVPRAEAGEGPAAAWTRWSLDAPLMMVRRPAGSWAAPAGLTFRTWLRLGSRAIPDRPPPTVDDLAYHLTTLFPQVRPKGYFEVRYIDAQPGHWWMVPGAVISTLLNDAPAAERVMDACAATIGRWRDGARAGLGDPELARAARQTLQIAASSLEHAGRPRLAEQVHGYLERWTDRGRCPADDNPSETDLNGTDQNSTDQWGEDT